MYSRSAALVLLVLSPVLLSAQTSSNASSQAQSPEQLARQMIKLTGGGDLGKQVMAQLVHGLRAADPNIPEEFWNELMSSVNAEEIEDLVVPVYVENLTVEEMSAAIEFYTSPEGRSLVKKLPAIVQQSMTVGQEWGERLAREAAERVEKYKASRPEA